MSNYNPQQVPIFLGLSPTVDMSSRAIRIPLTFSNSILSITDDLVYENEQGVIGNVGCVYVDNSSNPCPLILNFLEVPQTIAIPAYEQGYYPIAVHQTVRYTASLIGTPNGTVTVPIIFLNVPGPMLNWLTANYVAQSWSATNAGAASLSVVSASGPGLTAFATGFDVTGSGATGASNIQVTLASVIGTPSTLTWNVYVPALASGDVNFSIRFPSPVQCATLGAALTLSVPSMGAGNTAASAILYGYVR